MPVSQFRLFASHLAAAFLMVALTSGPALAQEPGLQSFGEQARQAGAAAARLLNVETEAAPTETDATTGAAAPRGPFLMLEDQPGHARVRIHFLPDDAAAVDRPSGADVWRLTVTGAYSSGDRFGPEGFVLRRGAAVRPVPQGWDGLLLVEADGRASLHDVSRVDFAGQRFNLRDRAQRKPFLEEAKRRGLSAIQSHLLINDGMLDLKPIEGAPAFRRRLLFQTRDGRLGVFDTTPRVLTLYAAAKVLQDTVEDVQMALNLDMGTYDYCQRRTPAARQICGRLSDTSQQALTNLIEFELPIAK